MRILAGLSATTTLLLTGAVAGVFFAYSVSVMMGLDAIGPEQAIAAMRGINDKIQNALFLTAFLLSPVAAAVTGVLLLVLGQRTAGVVFLLAGAVYVLGALVPSFAVNIPMNDALDAARPSAGEAARVWADYSSRWTAWNHLRTVSSLFSMVLAGLGMFVWGRQA
ncbi:anthrone oxygenase family protein [Actinomadura sp. DC4]|uniref:anthrone oxygenase family protein n=1 Tax=Actinomadura sp. DC4 TaxID=3055069 RepID=UPI0025B17E19|nr:anthrone oxygenase family protein [Actinomadura sp. DC4]MDN3351208.1 DUF1772 domain-containing protein [Actinomadura sp. DC4]